MMEDNWKQALAYYPELKDRDSDMYAAFQQRLRALEQNNLEFFASPLWPFALAEQVANDLHPNSLTPDQRQKAWIAEVRRQDAEQLQK